MHKQIPCIFTCIYTQASKHARTLTHTCTNTHINELPNIYNIAIMHVNKANLGASCGVPMETPTERRPGPQRVSLDRATRREGRGVRSRSPTAINGIPRRAGKWNPIHKIYKSCTYISTHIIIYIYTLSITLI